MPKPVTAGDSGQSTEVGGEVGRVSLTGAIAPLSDLGLWARDSLLEIVLLVLGAISLTRLRPDKGEVITAPNGQIVQVTKLVARLGPGDPRRPRPVLGRRQPGHRYPDI